MSIDPTSLVLGILLGALVSTALAAPRIGRIAAKALSVIAMAAGVGFLLLGILTLLGFAEFRAIGLERFNVTSPTEALGMGTGLLTGGILALVYAVTAPKR